jgi:hypothetical protein
LKRHLIIPDTQVRKGVPLNHVRAAGKAILEYRPTNIIVMGDWWDMPSLSSHEKPGSEHLEGARYQDDIDAGNDAFEMLVGPLKKSKWKPQRCDYLFGNHEIRVDRAVSAEPKYKGALTRRHMLTPGFTRHEFLEPVWRDGVVYSHYFQPSHSSKAIGGSIDSMLNRIGDSFVQGHVQGFKYGNRMYPTGKIRHGLVAGSFYQHDEHYRGAQGRTKDHWNGIVVLNDVRDGNYEIMPLSLDYVLRRFGGKR